MEEEKQKYELTTQEFQRCLKMAEIAIFINARRSEKPTSVFVVSQPGAGKTGLRSYLEGEEYSNYQFTDFDPDEVAAYHKYYNEILKEYPNDSHRQLQKFVLPALDEYLRYRAVQLRNNIIQEGTFASTPGYIHILEFQKFGGEAPIGEVDESGKNTLVPVEGNYFVDINVLAVHKLESLLSSYEREQYFIENGLAPRAVTQANHDRAYDKILETLRIVEEKNLYDRIRVFKRGRVETEPELVYAQKVGSTKSCVEEVERIRKENEREILSNPLEYLGRIASLRDRIQRNTTGNLEVQLQKLAELEEEFKRELEKHKGIETEGR